MFIGLVESDRPGWGWILDSSTIDTDPFFYLCLRSFPICPEDKML